MTTEQQATDEAAIRHQIDNLVAGIRAMDPEALRPVFVPDVVSFDIEPPLQHVGVEAKLKNWERAFAAFQSAPDYEVRDLEVTVGDGVAFVHSFNRLVGRFKNGVEAGMWVRYTGCFRKVDGQWLIAHDQVSVPMDVTTGKGLANLEP